jgi:hypothetical protein
MAGLNDYVAGVGVNAEALGAPDDG